MIWCIEDDNNIREIEVYTLNNTGFTAEGFCDGKSLWAALEKEIPELILLDIMLPDDDGIEILKRLKEDDRTCNIPVIMATAKGEEYDKIRGLDLGADDYLAKPFGMMEMVSRVKAVLRRYKPDEERESIIRFENLCLNIKEHRVYIEDIPVDFTHKEFEILRLFLNNRGRVFSREKLFYLVWGEDYIGESRTVDMHIKTLRKKLGKYGDYIKTVRSVGYRMEKQK
ncbi:MAG: response regulator transcription factor [Hornefia sp.]|nr:response regulator transcription factor [Hornefia sp.]